MQPTHALVWSLPFAGLVLSFALIPLAAPRWWHRHESHVALLWALALLIPRALALGPQAAAAEAWRHILADYLPFIALIAALYAAGGGVVLRGLARGTPGGNVALLAAGTLIAGLIGTAAASMLLIHPLLRANAHRRRRFHLVLGFILLVGNAGGGLSPLGPPLFLGFLHGVPFFWPLRNLGPAIGLIAAFVLAWVWVLDRHLSRGDPPPSPREPLRLRGWGNLALAAALGGTVLFEGLFPGPTLRIAGAPIPAGSFAGFGACLLALIASAALTPRAIRQANDFSWKPVTDLAWFFLALFITLSPVAASLPTYAAQPRTLFWLTGGLSALLDNAPSYLLAWNLAGNPTSGPALTALSGGAVLFGGLTYLGNAPNLAIRAIAAHRGTRMPSFLTYAAWATLALGPALAVLGWMGG